jgi:hypothetical protein
MSSTEPGVTKPEPSAFDFLSPRKTEGVMTVDQVAAALFFDRSTVYDMLLTGELEHLSRQGIGKAHKRITRRSFVAWCAKSVSVPPDEFITTLEKLAATLSFRQRQELLRRLSLSAS